MFFRTLSYVCLGGLLAAAVSGIVPVSHITVMLPAPSAVLLAHLAFSREGDLHWGLVAAIALGYLEDLQQGAPVGTLSLAHGLTYLLLLWCAKRVALRGAPSILIAVALTTWVLDLLTWGILTTLADPLGYSREALVAALGDSGWHVLATVLVAPLVWWMADGVERRLDRVLLGERAAREGTR